MKTTCSVHKSFETILTLSKQHAVLFEKEITDKIHMVYAKFFPS